MKPTYRKLWAGNLLMSDLTLKGQTRTANLKVLITRLLLVLEICSVNELSGNPGLGIF